MNRPGVVVLSGPDLTDAFAAAGVDAVALAADGDVRAAREELRRRGAVAVYVLGFGAGGHAALLAGTGDGVAGVISVCGSPAGEPTEAVREGRLTAPVLAFYAGADDTVPDPEIEAFYAALKDAHMLEETVVYDGVPRGFFADGAEEHAQAREDAWHRILRFVGVPAGR